MKEVEFMIGNKSMRLSREGVVQRLKGESSEPIRKHAVEIEGRLFPVKQAFELVTGLDRLDFTTAQARKHFQRLGFKTMRT